MGKPRFEDRKGWSGINKGASGDGGGREFFSEELMFDP